MDKRVGVCVDDAERIVGSVLRGMRRRGLPANVDSADLRQEGLIAIVTADPEKIARPALAYRIAKDAMVYSLRKHLLGNKRFYTGMVTADNSAGPSKITVDPWLVLDVGGQEKRQDEWERERAERWA